MHHSPFSFFATVPKGMETLLADELRTLGIEQPSPTLAGVAFQGTLAQAYRACLWTRLANRILLHLTTFSAPDADALYQGIQTIPWNEHLNVNGTLAVDLTSLHSQLTHTHFAALKVKDAIVDQFRARYQQRPNVDLLQPQVRINVHLRHDQAIVSIDLSGESLHRRGYREIGVEASLKENLAAAMLIRAGWQHLASEGKTLLDPMCGSGTLPIEAALMAADIAPGLLRHQFGFLHWQQHNSQLWAELLAEAQQRQQVGLTKLPPIIGYDANGQAVRVALTNLTLAGLTGKIHFERRALNQLTPPPHSGLMIINPPYGERLGTIAELQHLYNFLGERLRTQFQGWQVAILTANTELTKQLGIRAQKMYTLYNGALECKLLRFDITPERFMGYHFATHQNHPSPTQLPTPSSTNSNSDTSNPPSANLAISSNSQSHSISTNPPQANQAINTNSQPHSIPSPVNQITTHRQTHTVTSEKYTELPESDGAQMLANRLRKNLKHLERWTKREQIQCFRLYDADLPEYALAIDIYEQWVHVQEYAPPKTIDPHKAQQRLQEALTIIANVLAVPKAQIFLKIRQPQKGKTQYQKHNNQGQIYEVHEGKAIFLVNFTDYLDTGLFLDHRLTRQLIHDLAKGQRFLNLFGYTGTATVQAALGGARATTTVDISNTYLAWARQNLARNGFSDHRHQFIQADCLTWLSQEAERLTESARVSRYDLIFLDPPTFSNSKRMDNVLDIQRDHVDLIRAALDCLTPQGVLLFSTNYQRFEMNREALANVQLEDISRLTLPKDFERKPHIHQCWKIFPSNT
jgi:23S rRNA (guanine2445-N2)-methyltransferase / 23S rRNA (guanine2069-N7)-methyltransferase